MGSYIIATSSSCDLTKEYLEEHHIPFISYTYTIDDKLYEDDCSEDSRALGYKKMRSGSLLKTSMINEFLYYEFFKKLLSTGKDVIFLDMSREMSVSFANAVKAAKEVSAEFPRQKLYVMDTYCISGGLGILVENMVDLMEQGKTYDEVISWVENNKLKIAHRFTVDDLKYLKASGRVSNTSALIGSILAIKPVLYVPDRGTLDVVEKVRGRKTAIQMIEDGIISDLNEVNVENVVLKILHADCIEDAEQVKKRILDTFPNIKGVMISSLGIVIGAHVGPGLLSTYYLCGGRKPK